jgi:hypothetical protein
MAAKTMKIKAAHINAIRMKKRLRAPFPPLSLAAEIYYYTRASFFSMRVKKLLVLLQTN